MWARAGHSLDEARNLLHTALAGFRFASAADMSRAMAAMLTPAMVAGGTLNGRPPVDLGEADQSQTGKGYRNKITAAIYRHVPQAVTQRHSGVGSLEESFDRALISGATFIALDNVRGRVNSQAIESFLTEDTYLARCAYSRVTMIDPKRVTVMFTSNEADLTRDLANRSCCVRLLKQADDYHFPIYPEGDILNHVRTNQPRFLGAVFAIIREWHARGKPKTDETRHDFHVWTQTLDWIVQNILDVAPLMGGHRETQGRMTNPAMNWLRLVVLAVVRDGRTEEWLMAGDLIDIIDADGTVELPELKDDHSLDDEEARKSLLRLVGKKLKRCFGDSPVLKFDGWTIEREPWTDDDFRPRFRYRIDQNPDASKPAKAPKEAPSGTPQHETRTDPQDGLNYANKGLPRVEPRVDPAMDPATKTREPRVPRDRSELFEMNLPPASGRDLKKCITPSGGTRGLPSTRGTTETDPDDGWGDV